MDPRFNMKQIVGEMILLEHHMADRSQRCFDCQAKHLITIEALASEGIYLDKTGKMVPKFYAIGKEVRSVQRAFLKANERFPKIGEERDRAFERLAQRVRKLRKIYLREAIEFARYEQ